MPGTVEYVAIGVENRWLHVYRDLRDLVGDTPKKIAPVTIAPGDPLGGGKSRRGTEFFDADGRQFAPVFDEEWRLVDLEPVGEPDPHTLHRRVFAVIAHLDAFLPADNADAKELRHRFAGAPPLPQALDDCAPIFGHLPGDFHRAGALHNLAHRIFG